MIFSLSKETGEIDLIFFKYEYVEKSDVIQRLVLQPFSTQTLYVLYVSGDIQY